MQGTDEPGTGPRPEGGAAAAALLGPAGLGLGERLRSARKARALSVEQVGEALRLEVPTVLALEEGRFDALGAPVFVRGHLKRYAALVGLPVDAVLEAYRATAPESATPPSLMRPRETYEKVSLRPWGLWVLLPVCVLAAIIWFVGGRRGAPPPAVESTATETTTSPAFPDSGAPPPPPAATESDPVGQAPAAPAGAPADAPAAGPAPNPAGDAAAAAPRPVIAGNSVQLFFAEDSWINVADAERRLLYGLQRQGTRQDLKGRPPFHVMIGNARGVKVSVDGQAVELPPTAISDNVARFDVPAPPAAKPGTDR